MHDRPPTIVTPRTVRAANVTIDTYDRERRGELTGRQRRAARRRARRDLARLQRVDQVADRARQRERPDPATIDRAVAERQERRSREVFRPGVGYHAGVDAATSSLPTRATDA